MRNGNEQLQVTQIGLQSYDQVPAGGGTAIWNVVLVIKLIFDGDAT